MDIDKLMARVATKEGDKLMAYDDMTGKPLLPGMTLHGNLTIGRGRNLSGKGISEAESLYLERNDINDALVLSEREAWWPIVQGDDVRSRAMVEIVFNMGAAKIRGWRAIERLMERDFNGCADEFANSLWDKQVGVRADELEYMIRTGNDVPDTGIPNL